MAGEARIPLCRICPSAARIDKNSQQFLELQRTFPPGLQYILCELVTEEGKPYRAALRLKIKTEKEARAWIQQYQTRSRTTWRTKCSHPSSGRKMIARLERVCHHNTRTKANLTENRRTKNTDCPACLDIRIRRLIFNGGEKGKGRPYSRSRDPHMTAWPASLTLTAAHNHALDDPFILSHRDVSPVVKKKFIDLYKDGLSVKDALSKHKEDLAKEHGDNFDKIVSDRHYCPDVQYCYRLYYDIFRKDTKSLSKRKVQQLLEDRIDRFNEENGICIKQENVNGEDVVTIVTPLMKRVHTMLPSAGQTVYTNTYCSGPRKPQLFMLMADSFIGGLPLGCFVTGFDSGEGIKSGLEMIHELVGMGAYFGRGRMGPELFLTTNSEAERSALQTKYPNTKLVLNIFHVLQSFWQFLFDEENRIAESDRPYLFQQMRELIYCSTEVEMTLKYENIMADPVVLRYSNVVTHFKEIVGRQAFWTLFHLDLEGLTLSGNISHNFCDAAMNVLKDRPFEKLKSANPFQLLDIVISRVDGKCMTRLLDLAEGKVQKALTGRYGHVHALCVFKRDEILEELPMVFTMPIKKKNGVVQRLHIDMNVGFCTCPTGMSGGPCKHQYVLIKYFDIKHWKFETITDEQSKQWMTTVARGDAMADIDQLCTRLKEAVQREPAMFAKPMQTFMIRWAQLESDAALKDAVLAFNKATAPQPKKRKSDDADQEGSQQHKKAKSDGSESEAADAASIVQDITNFDESARLPPDWDTTLDADPSDTEVLPIAQVEDFAITDAHTSVQAKTPKKGKGRGKSPVQVLQKMPILPRQTRMPVQVFTGIPVNTMNNNQQRGIKVVPVRPVQGFLVAQTGQSVKVFPVSQKGGNSAAPASQGSPVKQAGGIIQVTPVKPTGASSQGTSATQAGTTIQVTPVKQTGAASITVTPVTDAGAQNQVTPLSQTPNQVPPVIQAETPNQVEMQLGGPVHVVPVAPNPEEPAEPMVIGVTELPAVQEGEIGHDTGPAEASFQEGSALDVAIEAMTSLQSMHGGSETIVVTPILPSSIDQGGLSGLADMADQAEKITRGVDPAAQDMEPDDSEKIVINL